MDPALDPQHCLLLKVAADPKLDPQLKFHIWIQQKMKELINKSVNFGLSVLLDSSTQGRMACSCHDTSFCLNLMGVVV